jgi:Flp pilus assembly protein TadG
MSTPITALIACLRRFAQRREGNTAIIFGLCAIPVIIAAGMAVDVTRAYTVKMRLASALDAAALSVGSESTSNNTTLQADLTAYFNANYPSSALGRNVSVAPIPASGQTPNQVNLAQAVVTYQATATVDMTFMQLVGVPNITVTATAQTHRGYGLEVALVLDNTGSMLCGDQDLGSCANGVVPSDTNCTNAGNASRICVLRNAALNFLATMENAITTSGQLYIGVVPYVTTVNISSLCTGAFSCTHMTQDACSGDFLDVSGNILAFPNGVMGTLSSTSTGVPPPNKTVTALTNNPGTTSDVTALMQIRAVDADGGTTSPAPLPAGTTIATTLPAANTTPSSLTLSQGATVAGAQILQVGFTGNTTSNSNVITNISPPLATWNDMLATPPVSLTGMVVTDNQTSTSTSLGYWTAGTNLPPNNAIQSIDKINNTITLCKVASATHTGVTFWTYDAIPYEPTSNTPLGNPTGATTESWMGCVVEPTSSDENSGVAGVINSSTSDPDTTEPSGGWPNWYPFWWRSGSGGFNSGINNWTPKTGSILGQTNLTEVQGQEITDWDHFSGPNQGCPVPILPLTDATTTAGQTAVSNTINAMWPRDAGGTQVHIGMIWGWRVLSANGPYGQTNNHPLTYADESTLAFKKAVILMTDGQEEWPDARQDTGLSYIADGKIGTTSNLGTAVTNLGTRLQSVCTNMKNSGNFVIYTIGLASTGSSNTALQNCATTNNGGFYVAATSVAQLNTAFQQIAQSLLTLRLTQ